MGRVTSLWRYPIKSHGREELASIDLTAGQTLPWDRYWAVIHSDSKFDSHAPEWVSCRNFMIGASTPNLAGIWAKLDTNARIVTLTHRDLGEITIAPDTSADQNRFVTWVSPLCPPEKRQPVGIATLGGRGITDTNYASISIMNTASHAAVAGRLGRKLEQERWRGNIWLNGLAPWEEWDWIDQEVTIGDAVLRVTERIQRCNHTTSNPTTGKRDTDTLGVLRDNWDHQDFGVYAQVVQSGHIAIGDTAKVI